jgi:hypothetical protein
MGEKWPIKFSLTITTSTEIVRDFLHAAQLRYGTNGFTSPPKEGVLRIFFARKILRLRPGLNPRSRVPEASTEAAETDQTNTVQYALIPLYIATCFIGKESSSDNSYKALQTQEFPMFSPYISVKSH